MVQTEYDETQCSEEAFKQRAENEIKTRQGTFISSQEKRSKISRFVKEGLRTKEKYFKEAYRKYFMLDDYPELEKEISFPCKISAMKKWFKNG